MRRLLVASQKGGVGKTTTAINLASLAALAEQHVLLIDADPLGSVACSLNLAAEAGFGPPDAAIPQGRLWPNVLPWLDVYDPYAAGAAREGDLENVLEWVGAAPALQTYDWIVFDSPPCTSPRAFHLLTHCDELLLVLRAEMLAYRTLPNFLEALKAARANQTRPNLRGILLTLPPGEPADSATATALQKALGHRLIGPAIPHDSAVGHALLDGMPVVVSRPETAAALHYKGVASRLGMVPCS
ncbi:MAG: ParA family protein [Gemmataceae bacterium]|nr:ParA family protein [Gemmataceae bacterium]